MSLQFQSIHFDHNDGEVRQRISWIRDTYDRQLARLCITKYRNKITFRQEC